MKYGNLISWVVIIGLAFNLSLSPVTADDHKAESRTHDIKRQTKQRTMSVKTISYKPPRVGAPKGRVGGGTRGDGQGNDYPILYVLAPDHTGLTIHTQPSLFWYISQPTTASIELTISRGQAVEPILEKRISSPGRPGIQRIQLVDYNVRLESGIEYQWFVALVPDPKYRSKDIIAGGFIKRIEPPEGLRAKLAQVDKQEVPYIYAEAGIWYDALSAISDLIDTISEDSTWWQRRKTLLEQVGFSGIALPHWQNK